LGEGVDLIRDRVCPYLSFTVEYCKSGLITPGAIFALDLTGCYS